MLDTVLGFLGLPSPKALAAYAIAFVIVSGAAFVGGWTVNGWRYEAALSKQKTEAAALLQEKTMEALELERKLQQKTNDLEVAHVQRVQEHDAQAGENATLTARLDAALVKLQQPGRGEGSRGDMSSCPATSAYVDHLQETNTKLSAAVAQFARRGNEIARSADRESEVAVFGVDYAETVYKALTPNQP